MAAGAAPQTHRSRISVDLDAIRTNTRALCERLGRRELWAVVKSDGYGHGAARVAPAVLAAGAAGLAVATLAEGRSLRERLSGARILILSPLAPGEEAQAAGFEVAVSSPDGWERLVASGVEDVAVHVKADTGMGRWGFEPAAALEVGRALAAGVPGLRLGALMSHLATAEDPDPSFARLQGERFRALAAEFPDCPRHLVNSAGALYHPELLFDGARCGVALFGVSPRDGDPEADGLVPAVTWTSRVAALKTLQPGSSTGYGRRFIAERETQVALVPVGYADGYQRALSGRSDVLIGARRCRVAATVSMDQLAAVVPDGHGVSVGDRVTLLGADGDERVGPEELARHAGTIGYELICALRFRPDRAERRYLPDDA